MRALLLLLVLLAPTVAATALPTLLVDVWSERTNVFRARVAACAAEPGHVLAVGRHYVGGTEVVPSEDPPWVWQGATRPTGDPDCPHAYDELLVPGMIPDISLEQCFRVDAAIVAGNAAADDDRACS